MQTVVVAEGEGGVAPDADVTSPAVGGEIELVAV